MLTSKKNICLKVLALVILATLIAGCTKKSDPVDGGRESDISFNHLYYNLDNDYENLAYNSILFYMQEADPPYDNEDKIKIRIEQLRAVQATPSSIHHVDRHTRDGEIIEETENGYIIDITGDHELEFTPNGFTLKSDNGTETKYEKLTIIEESTKKTQFYNLVRLFNANQ